MSASHPALVVSEVAFLLAMASQPLRAQAPADAPFVAVANRGQWPAPVHLRWQRGPATVWFETGGFLIALDRPGVPVADVAPEPVGTGRSAVRSPGGYAVRIRMGSGTAVPRGEREVRGRFGFYRGNDPTSWVAAAPGYEELRYAGAAPGIDVAVRGEGRTFAYDLHVAPGGDARDLVFTVEGSTGLSIDGEGRLVIGTPHGPIVQRAPKSQELGDAPRNVASRFELVDGSRYRLVAERRDASRPLLVDPGFDWATYLGGSGSDEGMVMVADPGSPGTVTVTGYTTSSDYPTKGAGSIPGGLSDVLVTRMAPYLLGANQLVWSVVLGGSANDSGFDLVTGSSGAVTAIVGYTASTDFPVKSAYQATHGGPAGGLDGFLAVLGPSGLLSSTYFGRAGQDWICAIEEHQPLIYTVCGYTESPLFPTTAGVFQPAHAGGGRDGFVMRFQPMAATPVVFLSYLGGNGQEGLFNLAAHVTNLDLMDLAIDASGDIFVSGRTLSTSFPATTGAYQTAYSGASGADIFLTKIDAKATSILYSTYIGAPGDDDPLEVLPLEGGRVAICGLAWSTGFPTTPGAYDTTHNGRADSVVVVLDPAGNGRQDLEYSTLLGSAGEDAPGGMTVDRAGILTVSGGGTAALPVTPGAMMGFRGTSMGHVFRLDPKGGGASDLHYLSHCGAGGVVNWWDSAWDHIEQADGRFVILGTTDGLSLPVSTGAYQTSHAGGLDDAWFLRSDLLPTGANPRYPGTPACHGPIDLQVNSKPVPGNLGFQVIAKDIPPAAPCILLLGSPLPSAVYPLPNVALWIDLGLPAILLFAGVSQPSGSMRVPLGLPAGLPSPASIAAQLVWLNPSSCTGSSLLSTSPGLVMTWP